MLKVNDLEQYNNSSGKMQLSSGKNTKPSSTFQITPNCNKRDTQQMEVKEVSRFID